MILVVNAGSSSIKFKLYETNDKNSPLPIVEGLAERIGVDGALTIKIEDQKYEYNDRYDNHLMTVESILKHFKELNVIKNELDIEGIGFRIVHGGDKIVKPVELTDQNKQAVEDNIKLAPLHNPGALTAINAFQKGLPKAKLVGCFDTSFHQTMPAKNYLYSVPLKWYENHKVRKYGFHGISFDYITEKASQILNKNKNDLNLVICHLGNGASMCCVKNGESYDTTMGLTPLAGLMMGTRCGDIDPSIIEYMAKELNQDVYQLTNSLNKESGLLGVSKISSDMREVSKAAIENHDEKALVALEMYTQRIAEYILKFANQLEGKVDAIVFTAGIGENSFITRKLVIDKVHLLNLKLDNETNLREYDDYLEISTNESAIKIIKIRTDEELMICKETLKFL
ncbi:acetate kinase [Spiroplasma tabanidicola]|uniref:Acetate kinase n=1 Tax=Spiroplasma tabanidicola TaxID=324079 RepID=A0A6I6C9S9_9MOLU|nr:acetate kinase [Spiroplasma tabanidicola]QGS52326.1 acetate kinase [Spiroplasma tabanidicola]